MVLCTRYLANNDVLQQSLPSAWCLLEVVSAPEQGAERAATGGVCGPLTRSFERENSQQESRVPQTVECGSGTGWGSDSKSILEMYLFLVMSMHVLFVGLCT